MNEDLEPELKAAQVVLLLGLVSFAPVVFLLCVFRLLSFFIMPSLFFHLLFIGFPIGGFIGARYFQSSLREFGRSLILLHAVMLASVGVCLLCKQADYLRATFYDLKTNLLLVQMAIFSAMFLPFFCAYGLCEYVGYQTGRRLLRGRMSTVYAAYLFGAAVAYLVVHFGISFLGVTRFMVASVALIVAAAWMTRCANKSWLTLELVLLSAITCWPNLESHFLDLYKGVYGGKAPRSTKGQAEEGGWNQIYQRWGRYALCELMESDKLQQINAFYNDLFQWSYNRPYGIPYASLDALPFLLVPQAGRVIIIGSGGGRQVQWAQQWRIGEIVAVELEPEVFRITRQRFPEKFDHVYEKPQVTAVRMEGRTYLSQSQHQFDLIFMPSVGGYPQMMLEPGNMIRTIEAYKLMKQHLTPRGVLAVWYPHGLDPRGILTRQYLDTFRSIGLYANWYANRSEILILSSQVPEQSLLPDQEVIAFFSGTSGPMKEAMPPQDIPSLILYRGDPQFSPITDEKPFLGGNIRHIFSLQQIQRVFALLALGVISVGAAAAFALRRRGDPAIPGISYWALSIVSLLVGANFLVMEHGLVIALFRGTYVFYDSLILGAIGFLTMTGLGSMLVRDRWRIPAYLLCAAACVVVLVFGRFLSPPSMVAMMLPISLVLGSFFPALFDAAEQNPLAVFAMDAIGAALGSLCAFFVPILFGLSQIFTVAAAICLCTLCCMTWFMRRIAGHHPA